MNTGLYILRFPNGKEYLGITLQSFREREINHKTAAFVGKNTPVAEAIRQFCGRFEMVPLIISDDANYLAEIEMRAIEVYNTLTPFGYNLSPGGAIIRKMNRICKRCKNDFLGGPIATYCGSSCRKKAVRERARIEKICESCKELFFSVIWDRARYCSLNCVAIGKNKRGVACKPVTVCGIQYPSMIAAARSLEVSVGCIPNRLRSSNWPEWQLTRRSF